MDADYFTNYCGYGPYSENYLFHSGIEHCISIFRRLDLRVESVVVLGAATGEVLKHFEDRWGSRPYGCEISEWAHERIPARFRRRVRRADMRDYVPELLAAGKYFDLIFSNSLVYLEEEEIPGFLEQCSRLAGHFHFFSSTSEDYEAGDRYRTTLKSAAWWKDAFLKAGFSATRSPYVFRSERRDAG
jgi:hypothetical protein